MNADLEIHRWQIGSALAELSKLFKPDMKLTFIARHPTHKERYVIVTEDDLAGLASLLAAESAKEAAPAVAGPSGTRNGS